MREFPQIHVIRERNVPLVTPFVPMNTMRHCKATSSSSWAFSTPIIIDTVNGVLFVAKCFPKRLDKCAEVCVGGLRSDARQSVLGPGPLVDHSSTLQLSSTIRIDCCPTLDPPEHSKPANSTVHLAISICKQSDESTLVCRTSNKIPPHRDDIAGSRAGYFNVLGFTP
jgi:hypothetical protein